MELFTKLIAIPIIGIVFFILVYSGGLKKWWVSILLILLHAAALCWLTLFVFHQPSWNWTEQQNLINQFATKEVDTAAYRYINDNFVLVDNSGDKELVPNPDGGEDSTVLVITNKRSLSNFIKLLNQISDKVDLVVCDINLEFSPEDSALQAGLLQLLGEKKLLLSVNENTSLNSYLNADFDKECFGSIREEGSGHLFVSHTIHKNNFFSLPYKLYAQLNRIETPAVSVRIIEEHSLSTSNNHYVSNLFFPQFSITDENLLLGKIVLPENSPLLTNTSENKSDGVNYFQLSEPLSEDGKKLFDSTLERRKKHHQKNIVFIGTFTSANEDVHATLYKELHGPTILLNVFYSLQLHQHWLSPLLVAVLYLGYCIITAVLIIRTQKIQLISTDVKKKLKIKWQDSTVRKKLKRWWKRIIKLAKKSRGRKLQQSEKQVNQPSFIQPFVAFIRFFAEFLFIEELHQLLLLGMIYALYRTTGKLMNIISLLLYFALINALLRSAYSQMMEKKGTPLKPLTHEDSSA